MMGVADILAIWAVPVFILLLDLNRCSLFLPLHRNQTLCRRTAILILYGQ